MQGNHRRRKHSLRLTRCKKQPREKVSVGQLFRMAENRGHLAKLIGTVSAGYVACELQQRLRDRFAHSLRQPGGYHEQLCKIRRGAKTRIPPEKFVTSEARERHLQAGTPRAP